MNFAARQEEQLVSRLQRALPLTAHGKPPLLAFLRKSMSIARTSPRLTVTNVFYAGDRKGLMCQFTIETEASPRVLVAPLSQIAIDRRHPIAQDIALYRIRARRFAAG